MPKLKNLSGEDIIKIFSSFDFHIVAQRDSHIKLKRTSRNSKQILTIPKHKKLDKGTLKAIYNQALKYIPETDLHPYFYSR